jgi:hypothetical protein
VIDPNEQYCAYLVRNELVKLPLDGGPGIVARIGAVPFYNMRVSQSGRLLVLLDSLNQVAVIKSDDLSVVQYPVPDVRAYITPEITLNDSLLLNGGSFINFYSGAWLAPVELPSFSIRSVEFSRNGDRILFSGENGFAVAEQWGAPPREFSTGYRLHSTQWLDDSLVLGAIDKSWNTDPSFSITYQLGIFDSRTGALIDTCELQQTSSFPPAPKLIGSDDGNSIVALSDGIVVWKRGASRSVRKPQDTPAVACEVDRVGQRVRLRAVNGVTLSLLSDALGRSLQVEDLTTEPGAVSFSIRHFAPAAYYGTASIASQTVPFKFIVAPAR